MIFADRRRAGKALGEALRTRLAGEADVIVIGLPRGGVPVAAEVAKALHAPLDVLCVRKLGFPDHPELGMGAIGEEDVRVLDDDLIARARVSERAIAAVEARERVELARRVDRYRRGRAPLPLRGRTVVIVDDGLATGGTARAAVQVAYARGARRVIVAVPVGAPESLAALGTDADAVVALTAPDRFVAVGAWYDDFTPTSDADVLAALDDAADALAATAPATRTDVRIPAEAVTLAGFLDVPVEPRGIVVFVHGSGSSRHSGRNQAVASHLNRHGFATLLFDLLTDREAADRTNVFDIALLSHRLELAVDFLDTRPELRNLPVGLFGASTGAAAALRVAAGPTSAVAAVVSRGGRPDLAADALGAVRCPVLLIVGGADLPTIEVNEQASTRLRAPHLIEIVPGATHLFEEPGALERVAHLATGWFERHVVLSTGPVGDGSPGPNALRER